MRFVRACIALVLLAVATTVVGPPSPAAASVPAFTWSSPTAWVMPTDVINADCEYEFLAVAPAEGGFYPATLAYERLDTGKQESLVIPVFGEASSSYQTTFCLESFDGEAYSATRMSWSRDAGTYYHLYGVVEYHADPGNPDKLRCVEMHAQPGSTARFVTDPIAPSPTTVLAADLDMLYDVTVYQYNEEDYGSAAGGVCWEADSRVLIAEFDDLPVRMKVGPADTVEEWWFRDMTTVP